MRTSKTIVATAMATSLAASAMVPVANAEVSANVGFVSDYYFRGDNLGDGGVYGGLDYENTGFFAGTWWIDDSTAGNDGMENDWYLGYGMDYDGFSWRAGYNRYEYTYTNDYEHEVVFGLGFLGFSAEIIKGEDDDTDLDAEGYTAFTLSYSAGAFSGTVGHFEMGDQKNNEYDWVELSFSGELVEGIDASFNIGAKSADDENADGYMYLDISKSFDL